MVRIWTKIMHFRGAMGAMMQFMLTIGILFVNALGIENAVDWSIITVLCIIPAGICICSNTLYSTTIDSHL